MSEIAGQSTVVTGAGRGLGRAMVLGLIKAGHAVVGIDRDRDELAALVADARGAGPGKLETLPVDLTDEASAPSIVSFAELKFGPVMSLVNCAGIGQETIRPTFNKDPIKFWNVDYTHWRAMFAVNADAVFRLSVAVTPGMIARGWGRIVNVTTSLESMIRAGAAPYGPSKAATEALSAIMARDLEGTGVTVNVLIPGGPAATRMIPESMSGAQGSFIAPEAMVSPIVWLLSPASNGVSGQRFRASAWNASLDPAEAAQALAAPIAWPGLPGGSAQVHAGWRRGTGQ